MRRAWLGLLFALGAVIAPGVLHAQGQETSFDVQTFRPAAHGRGMLSVESGGVPKQFELRGALWLI